MGLIITASNGFILIPNSAVDSPNAEGEDALETAGRMPALLLYHIQT